MMRHLQAILLRQRGDNRALVDEIKTRLSTDAQERLYRVLQAMETDAKAPKRRWGQS